MKNKNGEKKGFIGRLLNKFSNLKIFGKVKELIKYIDKKIKKSIRFELVLVFGACFLIAIISYGIMNDMFRSVKTNAQIKYDYSIIDHNAQNIVDEIEREKHAGKIKIDDSKLFENIIKSDSNNSDKVYISDIDGKVIYRNSNASEEKIDIFNVLKNISKFSKNEHEANEYTVLYPLSIGNGRYYLIYSGIPSARINYVDYEVTNSYLALMLSIIVFVVLFLIVTNKKTKYLDQIAKGIKYIADGDLSHRIPEDGNDEISNIALNVNNMADEINRRIKAQEVSEKTKADLITNVSHDLRTPLTSIMGYIEHMKMKKLCLNI